MLLKVLDRRRRIWQWRLGTPALTGTVMTGRRTRCLSSVPLLAFCANRPPCAHPHPSRPPLPPDLVQKAGGKVPRCRLPPLYLASAARTLSGVHAPAFISGSTGSAGGAAAGDTGPSSFSTMPRSVSSSMVCFRGSSSGRPYAFRAAVGFGFFAAAAGRATAHPPWSRGADTPHLQGFAGLAGLPPCHACGHGTWGFGGPRGLQAWRDGAARHGWWYGGSPHPAGCLGGRVVAGGRAGTGRRAGVCVVWSGGLRVRCVVCWVASVTGVW